MGSVGSM